MSQLDAPAAIRRAAARLATTNVSSAVVLLVAIVLLVIGSILAPGFGTPKNLLMVIGLTSFAGIVVLGQGAVMITGGIDLSVPWTFTFGAVLFSQIAGGQNVGILPALVVAFGAALVIGLAHASLIEFLRISPLIATLASAGILQGITLWMSNGTPSAAPPRLILDLAHQDFLGVPLRLIVWIALAAIVAAIFRRTPFGRHLFAMGENRVAAETAGIGGFAVLAGAYCLSAFLAALAGVLFAGFSGMSYLGMGDEFLLPSIAACVLGGISIYGGRGTVVGLLVGALFISILSTVLTVMNFSSGAKLAATGIAILLAVALLARAGAGESE
jgi:ribose transport system permease protein